MNVWGSGNARYLFPIFCGLLCLMRPLGFCDYFIASDIIICTQLALSSLFTHLTK